MTELLSNPQMGHTRSIVASGAASDDLVDAEEPAVQSVLMVVTSESALHGSEIPTIPPIPPFPI